MTTLNTQIRSLIQSFRDNLPEELNTLLEQGAGEISALDIVERALKVGDKVTNFDLPKYGGGNGRLADYLAKGPLVITFYRGVWCPYCNLQLKEYNERLAEITDRGATLVAITPEKPGALELLREGGASDQLLEGAVTGVKFDVLHDAENSVAEQFGLMFELPESHRIALAQFGVRVEELTGDGGFTFADPATYIVGRDGVIAYAFVPNNYRKRAEVDAITAALDALSVES